MRRLLRWGFIAGIGAAIAYLFDPDRGAQRRAQLADQARARARDLAEDADRTARYEAGKVKGAVADLIPDQPPEDDATLTQKVRSEAIGPSGVPTDHLEMHVDDGVVVLRGSVPSDGDAAELARRIREVAGVREVQVELSTDQA